MPTDWITVPFNTNPDLRTRLDLNFNTQNIYFKTKSVAGSTDLAPLTFRFSEEWVGNIKIWFQDFGIIITECTENDLSKKLESVPVDDESRVWMISRKKPEILNIFCNGVEVLSFNTNSVDGCKMGDNIDSVAIFTQNTAITDIFVGKSRLINFVGDTSNPLHKLWFTHYIATTLYIDNAILRNTLTIANTTACLNPNTNLYPNPNPNTNLYPNKVLSQYSTYAIKPNLCTWF